MAPGDDPRERRKGLLAIAAVTLIFALNFVAAHPIAAAADPVRVTLVRAVVAALVFLPVLLRPGGRRALTRGNVAAVVPLALSCVVGNQVLFLWATRLTTPTHVALVIATIPVFVAILARVWLGERLAPRRVAGIAVAFAGVALLAHQRSPSGRAQASAAGDGIALLAAGAFAFFTVANKRLVGRVGAFPATALMYGVAPVLLLPLALPGLFAARPATLRPVEWLSLAYLVVAATLVAYPLFAYALARLTASRVAVFTYLQPIVAAGLSWSLGWETFPPGTVAAALLAVTGVALAQRRAGTLPAGVAAASPSASGPARARARFDGP